MTETKKLKQCDLNMNEIMEDEMPQRIVEYPEEPDPDNPFEGLVIHMGAVRRQNQSRGARRKGDDNPDFLDRTKRPSLSNPMFQRRD